MTITRLTDPDDLNTTVDFDSPFRITDDGQVETSLDGIYAPDVVYVPITTPDVEIQDHKHPWKAWMGASNQYHYTGPIMHASEQLAGGMARDVLATPGVYCIVEVRDEDGSFPDADPIGWALVWYEEV